MIHPRTGMDCETANMCLVDNRVGGGMLWRRIHLPVEMIVGKDAFRRGACIIGGRNTQVTQGARRIVAAGGQKIPFLDASDCSCIRIQKQFMRVEAMALFRLIGPFDAVAIELTRGDASHPHMPHVTGPMTRGIQINDLRRRRVASISIELQANTGRVTAEQNEINSVSVLMCTPNRERISPLNFTLLRRSGKTVRRILLSCNFRH